MPHRPSFHSTDNAELLLIFSFSTLCLASWTNYGQWLGSALLTFPLSPGNSLFIRPSFVTHGTSHKPYGAAEGFVLSYLFDFFQRTSATPLYFPPAPFRIVLDEFLFFGFFLVDTPIRVPSDAFSSTTSYELFAGPSRSLVFPD